jgi:hypothetical protein
MAKVIGTDSGARGLFHGFVRRSGWRREHWRERYYEWRTSLKTAKLLAQDGQQGRIVPDLSRDPVAVSVNGGKVSIGTVKADCSMDLSGDPGCGWKREHWWRNVTTWRNEYGRRKG